MKCPECDGKGEVFDWGCNYTDGDYDICGRCKGTGQVYDDSDPQKWDQDHPGWGRFDGHLTSKWPNRFVVSGCENPSTIVDLMKAKYHKEYTFAIFNEDELFPGQDVMYMYPCVYFFMKSDRNPEAKVTRSEVDELYWY